MARYAYAGERVLRGSEPIVAGELVPGKNGAGSSAPWAGASTAASGRRGRRRRSAVGWSYVPGTPARPVPRPYPSVPVTDGTSYVVRPYPYPDPYRPDRSRPGRSRDPVPGPGTGTGYPVPGLPSGYRYPSVPFPAPVKRPRLGYPLRLPYPRGYNPRGFTAPGLNPRVPG